jgi:hypothetical protein
MPDSIVFFPVPASAWLGSSSVSVPGFLAARRSALLSTKRRPDPLNFLTGPELVDRQESPTGENGAFVLKIV